MSGLFARPCKFIHEGFGTSGEAAMMEPARGIEPGIAQGKQALGDREKASTMSESRREGRYDPEVEAARNLATALGWSFVDLEAYSISCGVLAKVPADLACRLRCVPMVINAHRAVLVVDDPFQGVYASIHPEIFGPPYRRSVEVALSTRRGLDRALHKRITVVNV